MQTRPLSITIIGWYLAVTSVLGIPGTILATQSPEYIAILETGRLPVPVQVATTVLNLVIMSVMGIGCLRGWNWVRIVFVGFYVYTGSMAFVNAGTQGLLLFLPGLFMGIIMGFFLFRPVAGRWFTQAKEN